MDEKLKRLLSTIPRDSRGWLELRRHVQETFLKEEKKAENQDVQDVEKQ
jgi:hypothetical protein